MAAPKGNQFAIGNTGREVVLCIISAFEKYFYECDNNTQEVITKRAC